MTFWLQWNVPGLNGSIFVTPNPSPLKPAIALARWRRRHRLTQVQAAARIGVNVRTLQTWEQGARQPRGFTLTSLLDKIKT